MLDKCGETRNESGKCGDEHYRVMTIWARSVKTKESTRRCHAVALIYEKALNKLVECIKMNPATSVKKDLDVALGYKRLLTADIELLSGFHA